MLPRVHIAIDDLQGAEIIAFLEAHVAQLRSLAPPESTHALDLDGLRAPGVRFWTASTTTARSSAARPSRPWTPTTAS